MKFEREEYGKFVIYNIIDKELIGSIEFIEKENFIENIYIDEKYRGKGYLTKIIKFLSNEYGNLYCLPLKEHREKFKHLGFTLWKSEGVDIYFEKLSKFLY